MPVVLVESGALKGRLFPLGAPGPFCIGRDQGAEIHLPDPMVSRRHLAIELREGSYVLRDLGSANGTHLNGQRVQERSLKLGDRILAGETLLTFLGDDPADPLVGKRLKGYELVSRIGRGGMGTVYLARQVSLERPVALKLLTSQMVEDPAFVERFLEEARSAARLNHPNIVMVYDIDDAVLDGERLFYYSMEYMAGGSVEDLLLHEGRLTTERALTVALDTARGLHYAERVGLVHRDIKPRNLMIHETGVVKIGDLGIAAWSRGAGSMVSQRGGVSGSPHYISPEQARGQDLDSRADIYSLGVSLFEMLAGRAPFQGSEVRELLLKQIREPAPDLGELRPDLPPPVAGLVATMLEKNRDARHPSARHLVEAIEETLAGLHAPVPLPSPPRARWSPRLLTGVAALVLCLGLVQGGWWALSRYRASRIERQKALEDHRQSLSEIVGTIERGELEEAAAALEALASTPALEEAFPAIAAEIGPLRARIEAAREARDEERREEEAAAALSTFRAGMPELAAVRAVKDLEGMLPPLEALERDHPGTSAAAEAAATAARVRAAIRELEARINRGQDALRSLLITAGTFLESEPPRYREALERLRAPPSELKGTPAESELGRRRLEITDRMVRDARTHAREADEAVAGGKSEAALRHLERLRDRMEGEALAIIEEAIGRIRGE